jgi:hypothetical protein
MENSSKKDILINEISEFVNDIQETTKDEQLFDIPFMIKYQLNDEISSSYDIYDIAFLEGISN